MLNRSAWIALISVSILLGGCTSPQNADPRLVDQDVAGRALPKVELKQCKPQTDTGPTIKKARLPRYPAVEFFNNKVGEVVIKFDVTESGSTDNVEIIRSTSQGFRSQVISAVQKWEFAPAQNGEIPIRVTCTQKHMFEKQ